ncbi:hypothetical protein RS9916_36982 [Synechococcus sp. RS9916]|nr:hypothetical protein RS9916_36982 [Synechococcus sp. RS9916]
MAAAVPALKTLCHQSAEHPTHHSSQGRVNPNGQSDGQPGEHRMGNQVGLQQAALRHQQCARRRTNRAHQQGHQQRQQPPGHGINHSSDSPDR